MEHECANTHVQAMRVWICVCMYCFCGGEAHSHTRVNKLSTTHHRNGWLYLFMESILRKTKEREREREGKRNKEGKKEEKKAVSEMLI